MSALTESTGISPSVRCGGNNLWNAADVVCFSCMTHGATLLTLRDYFRRHRILALCRVCAMYSIYILFLVIIVQILKPDHKKNPRPTLPSRIGHFWHAASYIEAIGIFWMYVITCIPIFMSDEATRVRVAIARAPDDLLDALLAWPPYQRHIERNSRAFSWTQMLHPYKLLRSYNTIFTIRFSLSYKSARGWR